MFLGRADADVGLQAAILGARDDVLSLIAEAVTNCMDAVLPMKSFIPVLPAMTLGRVAVAEGTMKVRLAWHRRSRRGGGARCPVPQGTMGGGPPLCFGTLSAAPSVIEDADVGPSTVFDAGRLPEGPQRAADGFRLRAEIAGSINPGDRLPGRSRDRGPQGPEDAVIGADDTPRAVPAAGRNASFALICHGFPLSQQSSATAPKTLMQRKATVGAGPKDPPM